MAIKISKWIWRYIISMCSFMTFVPDKINVEITDMGTYWKNTGNYIRTAMNRYERE